MALTDNGGALFLLSGASGSGKSTLARAVAEIVDDLAVHGDWAALVFGGADGPRRALVRAGSWLRGVGGCFRVGGSRRATRSLKRHTMRGALERAPSFTLSVTTDQPHCVLVFEPMGTTYDLTIGDEVRVHVYGRSARQDLADVEVSHELGTILLWIPSEYRAWNKAGENLRV